ncbi:thioredoxin domain-containing protein [Streptomyces sp. XD-27]|uniref:DsbA family protein n=1 Tax=Streptomyces sp. XD-27 TaxID=3062779 RepID=UPI0026F44B14|nr:thioredoxin domain-containing protein [Streptomyces sp. XD-27]WKX69790.1 thioredoxin domain-containing protein [Streptomyces sp. XD-27]
MSQRNGDGRDSARARMRAQRRQDEARDRRRRQLMVALIAVAVLGLAAGIGVLVAGGDGGDGNGGPVTAPSAAVGKDDLVIQTGRANAPATLTVYEDFRCPACKQFEGGLGRTIRDLEGKGRMKTDYHLVTIIDGNLGGSGSLNAANAAACAQDAGKYAPYHDVLFTNQPEETDDAYGKKDRLIELARQVKGLDTATFRRCVDGGTHDGWVRKSAKEFAGSGFTGTPTVLLDGKKVYGDPKNPLTPDRLGQLVDEAQR